MKRLTCSADVYPRGLAHDKQGLDPPRKQRARVQEETPIEGADGAAVTEAI